MNVDLPVPEMSPHFLSRASSISSESPGVPGRGRSVSLEHSIRRQSSTPSQACPPTQHSCLCCQEPLTIHPRLSIACARALAGVESAPHFPGPWGDHLSLKTNSGLKSPQISWFPGLLCPPFLDRPRPPTPQTQPSLPRLAMGQALNWGPGEG